MGTAWWGLAYVALICNSTFHVCIVVLELYLPRLFSMNDTGALSLEARRWMNQAEHIQSLSCRLSICDESAHSSSTLRTDQACGRNGLSQHDVWFCIGSQRAARSTFYIPVSKNPGSIQGIVSIRYDTAADKYAVLEFNMFHKKVNCGKQLSFKHTFKCTCFKATTLQGTIWIYIM